MRISLSLFAGLIAAVPLIAADSTVKLAVVVSIDQCRSDYLERFRPWFVDDGFRRLLEHGSVFAENRHRHAFTNTSSGHATLMTGVHADVHGIIGNDWLDSASLEQASSVTDATAPVIGAAVTAVRLPGAVLDNPEGISPGRLLATTVGDQLKLRHGRAARVISIANKDRSAVLMGGRLADSAYWVKRGRIVTSRFYHASLPEWVERFNAAGRVEADFRREWTRLLDASIYDAVQGPDSADGEEEPAGLGQVFPRRVDGGAPQITERFYEAHRISPFSAELIAEFAKAAVKAENLGRGAATDLLCIGFSQPDYCGHSFGPDSHEIMDSLLRLDRLLADLFEFLDAEVGAGKYLVVLSGDHGVGPLPERAAVPGRDLGAGRFDTAQARGAVEATLSATFGEPGGQDYWVVRDGPQFRLRRQTLEKKGLSADRVAAELKTALLRHPQIAVAYTRAEILAAGSDGDGLLAAVRRSFHAERSGDVYFALRPYVADRRPKGANHGTPYAYDSRVPLLWYGPGVPVMTRLESVGTDQLAPTLAAVLGVPRPPQAAAERLF